MKRFFIAVFALIFIVFAGLLVAPSFIDLNVYKGQAVQLIKSNTGLDVNIDGDINLALIPTPHFSVADVAVRAQPGSAQENILSFAALDVNVALMPLLQGQVQIKSVDLVKPVIAIDKKGGGNESFASLFAQHGAKKTTKRVKPGSQAQEPPVTIQNIRIKDGVFIQTEQEAGKTTRIENINMDVSAQSLQGPYEAQGSVFYDGRVFDLAAKTKKIDIENNLLPVSLQIKIKPENVQAQFDGVVGTGAGLSLQGKLSARIENIEKAAKINGVFQNDVGVVVSGLLTTDGGVISYNDVSIDLKQNKITASVQVDTMKSTIDAKLKTEKPLQISSFLKQNAPIKIVSLDASISASQAGVTFQSKSLILDQVPVTLSAKLQGFGGKMRPKIVIDVSAEKVPPGLLTDHGDGGSGKSQALPAQTQSAVKQSAAALNLPFDIALKAHIDEAAYHGKTVRGIDVALDVAQNGAVLNKLSIADFFSAKVSLSGDVKDMRQLRDITTYLQIETKNVRAFMQAFDMDTSGLPKGVDAFDVKVKTSGSLERQGFTVNARVLGADVIAKGAAHNVLGGMQLKDMSVQIKHSNTERVLKIFAGDGFGNKALAKPLDIYANLDMQKQAYGFSNIKADIAGMTVQGTLQADLGRKTPKVEGALDIGTLDLAAVLGAQTKPTSGSPGGANASGAGQERWSKKPIDLRSFYNADADITLSASRILYNGVALETPKGHIKLHNGLFEVDPFEAKAFDGSVSLKTTVQTAKEERMPVMLSGDVTLSQINLQKLVTGLVGSRLLKLSGSTDVTMTLKSTGASPATLIRDLNGEGNVSGSDIVLDGVNVTRFVRALSDESKPGDTVLGLWNGSTKGGQTRFDTLSGGFDVTSGVVALNDILLDGPEAAITSRGRVNLPEWTLETAHKMEVKPMEGVQDVPPFEISFKGSLDNPAQTFGQGLLQDYLNRKLQRKFEKFLSDKIGLPSNDNAPEAAAGGKVSQEGQPRTAPKPADPEDIAKEAIKGILTDLLR